MPFSSDAIEVETDFLIVAEMYIRVKADKIYHTRQVFTLMNWLIAQGGVTRAIMTIVAFIYGGYAKFNQVI